jgi:hypothetical protein
MDLWRGGGAHTEDAADADSGADAGAGSGAGGGFSPPFLRRGVAVAEADELAIFSEGQ